MKLPLDPTLYGHWVSVLISIGIVIDSLEIISSRHEYSACGILNWDILKLDKLFYLSRQASWLFNKLLGYPGYLILISLQLVFALAVLAAAPGIFLPLSITGMLFIKLLIHLRHQHGGLDGSDQMQLVILTSLTVFFWTIDPDIKRIALWFIAAQSILSYLAAGYAKFASPIWRSGKAMSGILATDNYGSLLLSSWLGRFPVLSPVVCWLVIVFECVAPVLVFAGPILCLAFLICGLLFHLTIAVIMGLNNFFWSFGATYPALLFLSLLWHFVGSHS